MTFVYLIETALGQIKIGCSHDPEQRLKTFAANSPCPIRLIARWPGQQADERALHKRFIAQRWHNEWFRYEGDLVAFVEQKRGVGVNEIAPWSALTFAAASERHKQSRAVAGEKRKALWADPTFRARAADNRRRRALYERKNAPCEAGFVEEVERFLERSGVPPWELGEAIGDRHFVWSLRWNTPKPALREAAREFMSRPIAKPQSERAA